MALSKHTDLDMILVMIFCFVDDFVKIAIGQLRHALKRPDSDNPPIKKHNLSIAELVSLAIFRFFTGHRDWKAFYYHVKTYHAKDFPNLPDYKNFVVAMNALAPFALLMLEAFMRAFRNQTLVSDPKFVDGMKLEVCKIKREFSHKVCKGLATKSKSSMGWFYGFRLHIICNELMQILNIRIATATVDERKALEQMWNKIFGMIIADAGYVSKNLQEKGAKLGKQLLAGARANMKKLMTQTQHHLLKLRQYVETVFSVLKLRFGIETSLPRSPLGYFAHYIWCLAAYQLKKFFETFTVKPLLA